jgi:hypothetical protein
MRKLRQKSQSHLPGKEALLGAHGPCSEPLGKVLGEEAWPRARWPSGCGGSLYFRELPRPSCLSSPEQEGTEYGALCSPAYKVLHKRVAELVVRGKEGLVRTLGASRGCVCVCLVIIRRLYADVEAAKHNS